MVAVLSTKNNSFLPYKKSEQSQMKMMEISSKKNFPFHKKRMYFLGKIDYSTEVINYFVELLQFLDLVQLIVIKVLSTVHPKILISPTIWEKLNQRSM